MTMTISPIYIWVGVLIFCLVAEACTVQLITIWFAVGSVGAMAAAAMGFGETVQLGVCLAVAIVMLLLLRPVVRGKLLTTVDRTMQIGFLTKQPLSFRQLMRSRKPDRFA